jgi:hypothetical protein
MLKKQSRGIEYWERQIKAWRRSGKSQVSYCKSKGLNLYSFRNWSRKFPEKIQVAAPPSKNRDRRPRFVAVSLGGKADFHDFELILSGERKLRFHSGVDMGKISELIQAIESC